MILIGILKAFNTNNNRQQGLQAEAGGILTSPFLQCYFYCICIAADNQGFCMYVTWFVLAYCFILCF